MVAQKIRVSFSDPDATDSDSRDDSSNNRRVLCRKAATKVEMFTGTPCTNNINPDHASTTIKSASGPPPPFARMRRAKVAPNRKFNGVYQRRPGRWAADFRSRRLNVRKWIGTFNSEKEAKAAYDAFKAQLSLGASSKAMAPDWVVPIRSPIRSTVSDESDQSEIGLNHQVDALSAVSSSPPCMFVLTSSPPTVTSVTSHEPLPYDDKRQTEEDPFFVEVLGHNDFADLPLPSLDDELDFSSGEWSLLNVDHVSVLCRK